MLRKLVFSPILFLAAAGLLFACKKNQETTSPDNSTVNMKVFEDKSIALPIEVIAGNNCLLSAYNTVNSEIKFNLTDNNGKLIWQKKFGVYFLTGMLKEADGTFTIFSGARLINFNADGAILKDISNFLSFYNTGFKIMHTVLTPNSNYLLYGNYNNGGSYYAFSAGVTHDGIVDFKKFYSINANVTSCAFTNDNGFLFYGNLFPTAISSNASFFILKADDSGVMQWQKNHLLSVNNDYTTTPFNTSAYGFYLYGFTHEIVKVTDGNYLCFANLPDYTSNDQRARIYKINTNGELLDSAYVQFGNYNRFTGGYSNSLSINASSSGTIGYSYIQNADGSLKVYMQNGFFGTKGNTNSFANNNRTYCFNIDANLHLSNIRYIQNNYNDCFVSVCKSTEGRTVAFGLISSFGSYYKPVLIFAYDSD